MPFAGGTAYDVPTSYFFDPATMLFNMSEHTGKYYLQLFKDAYDIFKENNPVKFASAIAYFSLFALPSMFLMILYVLNLLFTRSAILNELKEQLSRVVGEDGADILVVITANYYEQAAENTLSVLAYIVVVFWLSTQLFRLFQNSLNDLWRIKPVYENLWQRIWVERGLTFFLVMGTGLLFFASVFVERSLGFAATNILGDPDIHESVITTIVNIVTALLVFLWFSLLYKVIPAVNIQWEPTLVGAAVTAVLFFCGFWLIWFFVVERDLEDIYDKVAPIMVVILWVFYSSLVFLYGACLTKEYARLRGKQISPARYAYKYEVVHDEEFQQRKRGKYL